MNRNVRHLFYLMLSGFIIVIIYLTYLQSFKSEELLTNPANKRLLKWENSVLRGSIADRNGQILAKSVSVKGAMKRVYPFADITSHLIGYNSLRYGKSGLEKRYNTDLLGITQEEMLRGFVTRSDELPGRGNNLSLTIDIELQKLSARLLGKDKGAIVALNPQTGEILALVSKPDFNPSNIDKLWQQLNTDQSSPLINRTVQGLYPPGSTLKVMTGTGIAEEETLFNKTYNCPGYLMVGNYKLNCTGVHGKVNFFQAMAKSCNTAFGLMGLELGKENFSNLAERFGFNGQIPFDLPVAPSRLAALNQLADPELAQSAIGQGRTLVTPLHMALMAAGIANQGKMMQPFLVNQVTSPEGRVLKESSPQQYLNLMDIETAERITRGMSEVVKSGTGKGARVNGINIAGKTGSAQNPHGETHAWFIGFAPVQNPQIALAVIVENKGLGGKEAAPLARAIFAKALNKEVKR